MTDKAIHPLLVRGKQITEKVWTWTLKEHPHTVEGCRRGFEVRIYHYPAEGWDPYLVTLISKEGWVMDATYSPTEAAAISAALEILNDLARPCRPPLSASDAERMLDHVDHADRLSQTLLAAIAASGASPAQAKHALTRALGAVIGAATCSEADRAAAVSLATRAIAGYAEDASHLGRHGRELRPAKSRLN